MPDDNPSPLRRIAAAAIVATIAFWAYSRTLLPGVDVGDTGAFQAAAVWEETSARESYPLYFALGETFVRTVSPSNPARGLNLFSSLCGALAAGLLAFVVSGVTRAIAAGVVGGLLLAFSYTFWSQAIIAEVYTLHLFLIAACLAGLRGFERQPGRAALAAFFAIYALSFGNHYTMVLLLAPFAVFLVQAHPRPRELFRWPAISLALGIAALGSVTYAGNFLANWTAIDAPAGLADRLRAFWFDVTKSDWREAMVLGIGDSRLIDRLAMWWWDARQQFGVAGIIAAAAGALALLRQSRRWGVLVLASYAVTALFALTYNVGDVHVFFLPAHFFTAFAAGCVVSASTGAAGPPEGRPYTRRLVPHLVALALVAYAGWRGWETWPAVDRHADRRPSQLVARVVQGLDAEDAVLLSAMDWQSENALLYTARQQLPRLAWTRLADVQLHLPFFVEDNAALGRSVVLTAEAATAIVAAYGPLFPIVPDEAVQSMPLGERVAQLPPGTPYVLTVLPPTGFDRIDPAELARIVSALTGTSPEAPDTSYQVWAGTVGDRPVLTRSEPRPFRASFGLGGDRFTIRMESWIPDDTFRRAGFGRVLREREPVLTIERGISLLWFRPDGTPVQTYASGLYAPRPRFRIPAGAGAFALCSKTCGSSLPSWLY